MKSFALRNMWFLEMTIKHRHPLTAVVEAVRNAWQADAKIVVVYPNSKGKTCIADNGKGISEREWEEKFGGIGQSDKEFGPKGSLGVAMKLVAPILNRENGVRACSIVRNGTVLSGVTLGRVQHDKAKHWVEYGFLEAPSRLNANLRAPHLGTLGKSNWPYGTVIELGDTEFDAASHIRFLNSNFEAIPAGVDVFVADGDKLVRIRGRYSLMEEICGGEKLKHFSVGGAVIKYGFIKSGTKRTEQNVREQLDMVPVAVMFNRELVPKKSKALQHGGASVLNRMGIPVGGKSLLIVIEVGDTNEDGNPIEVTPTADRADIEENWPFDQILERISMSLPDDLMEFIQKELGSHDEFETGKLDALVKNALKGLGFLGMRVPTKDRGESSKTPRNSDGPVRPPNPSGKHRPTNEGTPRVVSFPEIDFTSDPQLEGVPFVYNPAKHMVLFNAKFESLQRALRLCKSAAEKRRVTHHWVIHNVKGLLEYCEEIGLPPAEAILGEAASWIPPLPKDRLKRLRKSD